MKPVKKNNQSKPPVPAKKQVVLSIFDRTENFFRNNEKATITVITLLGILFSFLLFDVKISEGNDDALYIEGGFNYATDFANYRFTANAPLYPFFLGGVVYLFGMNLMLMKAINVVFFNAAIVLLALAFRRRIPGLVLYPALLVMALNSYFLYYASQTYTESLFMMLQGLTLWGILSSFDKLDLHPGDLKKNWIHFLKIGLLIFLLTYCKNIAIGAVGALVLYFLISKKYLEMIYSVAGYALIKFPFEAIRSLIWGSSGQYSNQLQILMQKDAYNPSMGTEDISGFIGRFFGNFDIYISKRLYQILGFYNPDAIEIKTALGVFALLLGIFGIVMIFKHGNKPMMYLLLFAGVQMGLTFLVLQTKWDQPRLVLIYVPFILMIVFYGIYKFSENKGAGGFSLLLTVWMLVISSVFVSTSKKAVKNFPVLKKNLAGDKFYGYTPDWSNFLKLSEWCADSLPANSYVASRKAPMSFVYGHGKKFYPVYTVPAVDSLTKLSNPDSALALLKKEGVTHIIVANLRRNPKKVDGYIINTIHRMVYPISQKYPGKLKFVKKFGDTEDAQLYEIRYDN